ncbi:MAG: GTP pyrophosphokinase [Bacillota bacterium]|nr:GTP pyrophosphokinase [Bacillota bacterium]
MKLDIINFVDQAMDDISKNSAELDQARLDIVGLMEYLFQDDDYILNVNSRVKSPTSVKEKILRNNLYKDVEDTRTLIGQISDLIGVRIECRFIPDEEKVYSKLLEKFNINVGGGYYSCKKNTNISIKVNEPQPQFQKNGFEIYKIDGHYYNNHKVYNFELQIKSLVNNFWGDIEHRILYKNYNYIVSESFIKDIMGSIKENLTLIDKQLRVVYYHVFNLGSISTNQVDQIKDVLKKMTYDVYFHKIRKQLGFVVDFRGIVDLIVDYIFIRDGENGKSQIAKNFLDVLNKLSGTINRQQSFGENIEIPDQISFPDPRSEKIGKAIVEVINKDFKWNIFFKIINDIEAEEKPHCLVEKFSVYLLDKFSRICSQVVDESNFYQADQYIEIKDYLLDAVIDSFIADAEVENLDDITLNSLTSNLKGYLLGIVSYEEWEENKEDIRRGILSFKSPK